MSQQAKIKNGKIGEVLVELELLKRDWHVERLGHALIDGRALRAALPPRGQAHGCGKPGRFSKPCNAATGRESSALRVRQSRLSGNGKARRICTACPSSLRRSRSAGFGGRSARPFMSS